LPARTQCKRDNAQKCCVTNSHDAEGAVSGVITISIGWMTIMARGMPAGMRF
jgi:hypothetical protein